MATQNPVEQGYLPLEAQVDRFMLKFQLIIILLMKKLRLPKKVTSTKWKNRGEAISDPEMISEMRNLVQQTFCGENIYYIGKLFLRREILDIWHKPFKLVSLSISSTTINFVKVLVQGIYLVVLCLRI